MRRANILVNAGTIGKDNDGLASISRDCDLLIDRADIDDDRLAVDQRSRGVNPLDRDIRLRRSQADRPLTTLLYPAVAGAERQAASGW